MRRVLLTILNAYRRSLSPDHGWFRRLFPNGYCRYYPTCSSYACRAIEKHGAARGSLLAIWRVLRCNPWSKGGFDYLK